MRMVWRPLLVAAALVGGSVSAHADPAPADTVPGAPKAARSGEPSFWERFRRFLDGMLSPEKKKPTSATAQGDYLSVAGAVSSTVMLVETSSDPLILPLDSPYKKHVRILSGPGIGDSAMVELAPRLGDAVFPGVRLVPGVLKFEVVEDIASDYSKPSIITVNVVATTGAEFPPDLVDTDDRTGMVAIKRALRLYFGAQEKGPENGGEVSNTPPVYNPWSLEAYQILYTVSRSAKQPEVRQSAQELMTLVRQARIPDKE